VRRSLLLCPSARSKQRVNRPKTCYILHLTCQQRTSLLAATIQALKSAKLPKSLKSVIQAPPRKQLPPIFVSLIHIPAKLAATASLRKPVFFPPKKGFIFDSSQHLQNQKRMNLKLKIELIKIPHSKTETNMAAGSSTGTPGKTTSTP
jgi:hypothetical protein